MFTCTMITDEEFEKLNFYEQRDYRWCSNYEMYYNKDLNESCGYLVVKDKCNNCTRGRSNNATNYVVL